MPQANAGHNYSTWDMLNDFYKVANGLAPPAPPKRIVNGKPVADPEARSNFMRDDLDYLRSFAKRHFGLTPGQPIDPDRVRSALLGNLNPQRLHWNADRDTNDGINVMTGPIANILSDNGMKMSYPKTVEEPGGYSFATGEGFPVHPYHWEPTPATHATTRGVLNDAGQVGVALIPGGEETKATKIAGEGTLAAERMAQAPVLDWLARTGNRLTNGALLPADWQVKSLARKWLGADGVTPEAVAALKSRYAQLGLDMPNFLDSASQLATKGQEVATNLRDAVKPGGEASQVWKNYVDPALGDITRQADAQIRRLFPDPRTAEQMAQAGRDAAAGASKAKRAAAAAIADRQAQAATLGKVALTDLPEDFARKVSAFRNSGGPAGMADAGEAMFQAQVRDDMRRRLGISPRGDLSGVKPYVTSDSIPPNLGTVFGDKAGDFGEGLSRTIARRDMIDAIGTGLADTAVSRGQQQADAAKRVLGAASSTSGKFDLAKWGNAPTDAERAGLVRMMTGPADFTRLAPDMMREVPTSRFRFAQTPVAYNPYLYLDLARLGMAPQPSSSAQTPAYQFPPKRVTP